ncbi:hypothetical protein RB597_001290 [Gaeumannomyces tritici]
MSVAGRASQHAARSTIQPIADRAKQPLDVCHSLAKRTSAAMKLLTSTLFASLALAVAASSDELAQIAFYSGKQCHGKQLAMARPPAHGCYPVAPGAGRHQSMSATVAADFNQTCVSFYSDERCTISDMVATARPNETCVNFYFEPVNSYRVRDLRPFSPSGSVNGTGNRLMETGAGGI